MSRAGMLTMVLLVAGSIAMGGDMKAQGFVAGPEGAGASKSHHSSNAQGGKAAFDFYLLTLSWSPEFCVSQHMTPPECAAHPAFVLHGLWPQVANSTKFLENCSHAAGPSNPGQYKDIFPDGGLLKHEWQTHGTCSGLGPDAYFHAAREAKQGVAIPAAFQQMPGQLQLTPQQIIADFAQANPEFPAGSIVLSCGNNHLTAVEVCLSKGLKAVACQGVKTCHANVVKVTPPGATTD